MRAVTIEIPENVLVGSGQSTEDFAKEAKLLLFAKLFELGRISSGKAAETCGMNSRRVPARCRQARSFARPTGRGRAEARAGGCLKKRSLRTVDH